MITAPSAPSITPIFAPSDSLGLHGAISSPNTAAFSLPGDTGAGVTFSSDDGIGVDTSNLKDQFFVFQMSTETSGPTILESTQVKPLIQGGKDTPDVLLAVEMVSFHLGQAENVDPHTKATLRLNIGKDESSSDKKFDAAFWSIAAGLSLYDQVKGKAAAGKDLKSDFQAAFGGRPVEVPGGLSKITFDVIKHKEPPWWKKIFSFLESGTGQALVSTLGFPALAEQAVKVVDELLDKLDNSSPEILFHGFPMKLALSQYARDEFSGGNPRVKLGCLNRGFCIFTRGRDFNTVANSNAIYYPTYGKLVPATVDQADLLTGRYDDPLKDVTYGVFRFGTKDVKLDPTFQYGSN